MATDSSKTFLTRAPVLRLFGAVLAALLLVGTTAGLASAQGKYAFGERNRKKVVKAVGLMQAEGTPEEQAANNKQAREILESINLKRAKPYGRARIMSFLANFYIADDEDHARGLELLEQVVAEGALQPEDHLRTMFMVGQLQTMLERYDDAIETLESWISQVESPSPQSYYTLAVTYYQGERLDDALEPARKAVELSVDTPREAWYRLLLSLHLTRSEYPEALALLDDIVLAYPKEAYWSQMAAIYAELDQMNKSLAVQQLAKGEGFVTADRDLTRMAQMLMVEGLPHRGAEIMKKGLEDGAIEPTKQAYMTYSDTLLQSREWAEAVDPLSKAAELAEDGALYMRLAQVNLQLGRWNDAIGSLDDAFDKGGLNDEGQAHILYGIAAFNAKKWNTATRAFTRAEGFEGVASTATKWKAYVDREKIRLGVQ